jgi:biopolymer transport protein ExbD
MFLGEKPITMAMLMQELSAQRERSDKVVVLLKADKALPYFWITRVSSVLKSVGINTVYLVLRGDGRPYEQLVAVRLPGLETVLPSSFPQP